MSGNSTLDPDNLPGLPDRSLGRGHDIGTLGPGDTSDSGSDMKGTVRRKGTQRQRLTADAEELDELRGIPAADESDTDSQGTGERASVDRDDEYVDGADIEVDHIEKIPPA
ncbi:MAG TPA: hypothetical protein VIF60_19505 [Burkholderiaceae bacterium]